MLVFAHVSDTHFDGGRRALDRARRTMTYLRGVRLDAILVTGDIADHGTADAYEQARAELVADVPVLMTPGNHDDRAAHAHTAAATTFAGRPMIVAPGVVSTLRLPWTTDDEMTWDTAIDLDAAPAVAFHVYADGRLTTHYRVVP